MGLKVRWAFMFFRIRRFKSHARFNTSSGYRYVVVRKHFFLRYAEQTTWHLGLSYEVDTIRTNRADSKVHNRCYMLPGSSFSKTWLLLSRANPEHIWTWTDLMWISRSSWMPNEMAQDMLHFALLGVTGGLRMNLLTSPQYLFSPLNQVSINTILLRLLKVDW
jgi:hypothetical protein